MRLFLSLIVFALSDLALAIPAKSESRSIYVSERDVLPQAMEIGDIHEKRMLSAGLAKAGAPTYKKLAPAEVSAIKKSAADLKTILSEHPGALVLALGNSPAYTLAAISSADRQRLNIYEAPVSGGLPHMVPMTKAQAYAKTVLEPILKKANNFNKVILVDIYGTGASKNEYKALLAACEPLLKMKTGSLSEPSQIAIIDEGKAPPKSDIVVPIIGTVTMGVKGLATALTDGLYPRIVALYPLSSFGQNPEQIAVQNRLDDKGRTEVLKAIQG